MKILSHVNRLTSGTLKNLHMSVRKGQSNSVERLNIIATMSQRIAKWPVSSCECSQLHQLENKLAPPLSITKTQRKEVAHWCHETAKSCRLSIHRAPVSHQGLTSSHVAEQMMNGFSYNTPTATSNSFYECHQATQKFVWFHFIPFSKKKAETNKQTKTLETQIIMV